jgi:hypothetical protein
VNESVLALLSFVTATESLWFLNDPIPVSVMLIQFDVNKYDPANSLEVDQSTFLDRYTTERDFVQTWKMRAYVALIRTEAEIAAIVIFCETCRRTIVYS